MNRHPDLPPTAWRSDPEPLPTIALLVTAAHAKTPDLARKLATSAGLLADVFLARIKRGENGPEDAELTLLLRDASATLNEHARNLEARFDREAEAFGARLGEAL